MEEEIWKPIKEDDRYEVSNFGNVRSWNNSGKHRHGRRNTPRILKSRRCGKGYLTIMLGHRKQRYISHLVAKVFILNPNEYGEVDHIDGNKENNRVENLRWVNRSLNSQNTRLRKDNTSGLKGVRYVPERKKWTCIWSVEKQMYRKYFDTQEEAIEHRRQMVELHYSDEHYIENR